MSKIIKSYLFYMISAFGISLTIKASVGVSSFNAMNVAIADATDIKVGTITMFFNIAFLLYYMMLTHFKLPKKYVIQGISLYLFGFFINFFTYTLLGSLVIEGYFYQIATIILGTLIGGVSVGMIVRYSTITFPIESVCDVLSEKTRFSFTQLRYAVDVFSIAVSLSVSFAFSLPLYVREGTLISLLIFSYTMGKVKNACFD